METCLQALDITWSVTHIKTAAKSGWVWGACQWQCCSQQYQTLPYEIVDCFFGVTSLTARKYNVRALFPDFWNRAVMFYLKGALLRFCVRVCVILNCAYRDNVHNSYTGWISHPIVPLPPRCPSGRKISTLRLIPLCATMYWRFKYTNGALPNSFRFGDVTFFLNGVRYFLVF